jgi:hypothetical protein
MGVGLGEVAAQPVTHALVSGLYPAEKRGRVLSIVAPQPVTARQAIAKLPSRRSYRLLLIGMTMSLISFSAMQGWLPAGAALG